MLVREELFFFQGCRFQQKPSKISLNAIRLLLHLTYFGERAAQTVKMIFCPILNIKLKIPATGCLRHYLVSYDTQGGQSSR